MASQAPRIACHGGAAIAAGLDLFAAALEALQRLHDGYQLELVALDARTDKLVEAKGLFQMQVRMARCQHEHNLQQVVDMRQDVEEEEMHNYNCELELSTREQELEEVGETFTKLGHRGAEAAVREAVLERYEK